MREASANEQDKASAIHTDFRFHLNTGIFGATLRKIYTLSFTRHA